MKLKIFLTTSFILLIGSGSKAITTPQTYCASLPAVSCEVLNTEVHALTSISTVITIKYCRNKLFGTVIYSGTISTGGLVLLGDGNGHTGQSKLDTSSLCAPFFFSGNSALP